MWEVVDRAGEGEVYLKETQLQQEPGTDQILIGGAQAASDASV